MYPADWHKTYGDMTGNSARQIMPPLVDLFGIKSVVEVGCGNAHWTQATLDSGATDYLVVDGPWNDRDHLLVDRENFQIANLNEPLKLPRRFDAAICLEVAEHVEAASADIIVRSLTDASDVVIFGAATPYQGGHGHINEQWPSWWREKFDTAGYEAFDLVRPHHWQDQSIHYWYRQNMFVYVARSNEAQLERARAAQTQNTAMLFDAVHPEKFEEVASYQAIAMKRLIKQLPGWISRRIKNRVGE